MDVKWWMFIAGLILGGSAGFFTACLIMMARDEMLGKMLREEKRDAATKL